MHVSIKWLLILTLTGVHAQEPRKKNGRYSSEEPFVVEQSADYVSCSIGNCVKRSSGQEEFGPFWANRGKKDPTYIRSKLFAEEPQWILVRQDEKDINDNEPFYVTRGKKNPDEERKLFWKNFTKKRSYDLL
ncbi:uncharacterized protein LOC123006501 [Tribolium madens]|uniref:uncharacterized protein LOC123006501 n=1 Tax=Tribolium madens TaxID=41895 RepID=UPI001CF761F0|nr:uncharacterized protein LOC123006501 [Tribolium madens]